MAENRWKRVILVGFLLALPGLAVAVTQFSGLSLQALLASRDSFREFAQAHEIAALSIYVAAYVAAVALSIPGALILTLMGGFLFGALKGGLAAILGASLGASLIFWLARGILRDFFKGKADGLVAKMAGNFQENAFSYLLFLRLIPVFPFFLVNIVPAFCRVSLPVFASATFFGIMPATFAIAAIGAGLDDVIARAGADGFSPANLLTPPLWVGLCVLGFLSLLPVAYKRIQKRKTKAKAGEP